MEKRQGGAEGEGRLSSWNRAADWLRPALASRNVNTSIHKIVVVGNPHLTRAYSKQIVPRGRSVLTVTHSLAATSWSHFIDVSLSVRHGKVCPSLFVVI